MLNPTLQGHTSTHSHMQPAGLFSLAEENLDVEETSCFLMSQLVNENSLNLDLKGFFTVLDLYWKEKITRISSEKVELPTPCQHLNT